MKQTEIAYIAGLLDGEGSIAVVSYKSSKNGARYDRLVVRITNTNLDCLEWTRDKIGAGSVHKEKMYKGRNLVCYRYVLTNAKAAQILRLVIPFLIIKRDLAATILAGKISGRSNAK